MTRRPRYLRGPRTRWLTESGDWAVRARVERFVEPALLLLLRERPTHGYELIDALPELIPDERIDMGNLYRILRALEDEGLVRSEWDAALPGPAKRTYELTDEGRAVLDRWADALGELQGRVDAFHTRYAEERG